MFIYLSASLERWDLQWGNPFRPAGVAPPTALPCPHDRESFHTRNQSH